MIEYTVRVYDDRTEWLLNGELHREDGPALEYAHGSKSWFLNGKLHRVDGPAREWATGSKEWYLNGKKLTEQEFKERTETKEITMAELNQLLGYNVKIKE